MATGTCAVFEFENDATETNIPLVTFSNGRVKRHVEDCGLKTSCYFSVATEDGIKRKRLQKILVADSGRIQYVGYNYGPNALKTNGACRFHVGIRNKRTGTLKVLPASLFHMQPLLNSVEDPEEENDDKTKFEKRDDLTSAFGSKKKRQTMESRKRHSVHAGSLQASASTLIQQAVVVNPTTETLKDDSQTATAELIPPRNAQAELPQDIYKLDNIFSAEELDALQGWAQEVSSADREEIQKWISETKCSNFVLSCLTHLPSMKKERTETLALLLYYNYLVMLLRLSFADFKKKDPLPEVFEPVKKCLLEKFTLKSVDPSGRVTRTLPQRLKDKVVAYALVIALHVEKFSLTLSSVQPDFKLPLTRLVTICCAVGCHVSTRRSPDGLTSKMAELKIPLFDMNKPKRFAKKRT